MDSSDIDPRCIALHVPRSTEEYIPKSLRRLREYPGMPFPLTVCKRFPDNLIDLIHRCPCNIIKGINTVYYLTAKLRYWTILDEEFIVAKMSQLHICHRFSDPSK